jgi:hypothetical protein
MLRSDRADGPFHAVRSWVREQQRWVWVLPVLVALTLRTASADQIQRIVEAIVGVGVIFLAYRAPGRAILVLVALLPFHLLGLALLYRVGLPAGVVRGLGAWKEGLGLGVAASAIVASIRYRQRVDLIDKLAFAYLIIVTFYLAFPRLIAPPGLLTPGAPLTWNLRFLAYRSDVAFVLVFLAARHAPVGPEFRGRLVRVVLVTGTVVAALGILHFLAPSTWTNFVLETARVPQYETNVIRLSPAGLDSLLHELNVTPVRAGSVLLSPFSLGDYLLISFAFAIEIVTRARASALAHLAVAVIGIGLVMTFARAGVLGGLVIILVATRPLPGRTGSARLRFAVLALIVFVLAAPGLYQTRLSGANGGSASSTEHIRETTTGLVNLTKKPLGSGLGTAPGVGDRFSTPQTIVSDNSYVQVGNELGILTMLVFVALLVALVPKLRAAAGVDPSDMLSAGARAACIGLIVSGLFHHVWIDFPVSWTLWLTAGLALGVSDRLTSEPQGRPGTLSRQRPAAGPTTRTTTPWSSGST